MSSAAVGEDLAGGLETKTQLKHSSDIDLDYGDPLCVTEYQEDIYKYFKKLEACAFYFSPDFMDKQLNIDWNKHCILVERMIQLRSEMKLLQETILLAVNILHRFLSARAVSTDKVELVGLCCLLIAIKYEEVYVPSISLLLSLSMDTSSTKFEIIEGEKYILKTLDWDLRASGPLSWLRKASEADDYDVKSRNLAKYLIDISLAEKKLVRVVPSLLSASALWLARVVSNRGTWNTELKHLSTYSENELLPVASIMVDYILVQPPPHSELYNFYDTKKHFMVILDYSSNTLNPPPSVG
ncbi:cyclin-like protein [Crepidotus variabilis]|uniref:Cyclin-like protein n=1 Tax=Crepidotus variabilis TaxID=179855 RepID=A0A9P6E569_9AGAR|nr:cyclin-like protein [Crepidotus variabilis]